MSVQIAINGACGRMGQRVADLAHNDPAIQITAALESPTHPMIGQDLGKVVSGEPWGVEIATNLQGDAEVMIDFSNPDGLRSVLDTCLDRTVALIVATTGMSEELFHRIEQASIRIPIIRAPNLSVSVNLLLKLVSETATVLADDEPDIEIIERHHRFKKDAPSGTALEFARVITEATGPMKYLHGRDGETGERSRREIGIHAVRVGENPGEHAVIFSLLGETIELVHKSQSRDSYARGAIRASKFLAGRPPGKYNMLDVLGLNHSR